MRKSKNRKQQGAKQTVRKKSPRPAKDRERDSEDIERAVYDGMQDLRVKRPS